MLPSPNPRPFSCRKSERGYVLLTLLLVVALLIVAAAAIVPSVAFEIRRDREQELIHRGVQYSRAIRAYYKKVGRYPTRIEELESTNNLRFLRKRYKDPITGQDFKLLHYGEVKMTIGAPIAGASPIAGLNPASPNGFGPANGPGGMSAPSRFGAATTPATTPDPNTQPGTNQAPGTDPSQASGTTQGSSQGQPADKSSGSSSSQTGPTFGGGPIVGVVSTSKKDSIREFNHKKKYEEWQFIYDPANDRGGLLSTPNQPPLQGAGNQLGQPAQQNQNNSPFGPSQPSPGMGNNPNPNPNPPPSNPPQQQ